MNAKQQQLDIILKITSVYMLIIAGLFLLPVTIGTLILAPWAYSEEIKKYVKAKYASIVA